LQVGDEDLEVAVDDGLAEHIVPHDLPKTLAPDRHVPTAMRQHPAPTVDIRYPYSDI
jgi:hypothetical protein